MTNTSPAIFRLTVLWAFCESGLGGWLHALQLPVTGLFIGAFAITIISLISFYSQNNFKQIMQATTMVILIKAAVSPHSPPTAYFAVLFQGISGALIFRYISSFKIAAIFLGILTMIESALQKIIIATLIYGNAFWDAIDNFFQLMLSSIDIHWAPNYSYWLIVIYLSIYGIWGFILGIWIAKLPVRIKEQSQTIKNKWKEISGKDLKHPSLPPFSKPKPFLQIFLGLAFILIMIFLDPDKKYGVGFIIIVRTIIALLLYIWVIGPLVKWLLDKKLKKTSKDQQSTMQRTLGALPGIKENVHVAYSLVHDLKGLKKLSRFVLILLVITLHPDNIDP